MAKKFILIFILIPFITQAQTQVSGSQSGIWTSNRSPYIVTGDITVNQSDTLRIEPGVTVRFDGYYKFIVDGTLLAAGTEQDSIIFTASDLATGWHGIRLRDNQSGSVFRFCRFEYGRTQGDTYPDQHGGAIMMHNTNAVFSHCVFLHNTADTGSDGMGGAIYALNSGPATQITQCLFKDNEAYGEGGAIKFSGDSGAQIDSCRFINNSVSYGGGALCLYGCVGTRITNSLFTANHTIYHSGGAALVESYSQSIQFVNCTIIGNSADNGDGGAVYIPYSEASFTNSIIKNNPGAYSNNIYLDSGYAEINYCDTPVPSDATGNHNINTDPQFVDANHGDFHLQSSSPCIDAGIDSLTITTAYDDTLTVVNLNPSQYNGSAPDMGCYEFRQTQSVGKHIIHHIKIYPNPANRFVFFEIPEKDIFSISIMNLSGQIIRKKSFGQKSGVSVIDIHFLPPGTYLLLIETKRNIYRGSLVKQ